MLGEAQDEVKGSGAAYGLRNERALESHLGRERLTKCGVAKRIRVVGR